MSMKNKGTTNVLNLKSTTYYISEHLKILNTETVHEGQSNNKCAEYGKTFTTSGYLKTHIEIVHEEQIDHKCAECGKAFSTLGNLK